MIKLLSIVAALFFIWRFPPRALPQSSPPKPVPAPGASYLALGDSYTIGESVDPAERYPVQAAGLLNKIDRLTCQNPEIIAVTGWTTGNLLDALSEVKPVATYRIVSLLIGVNNQFQGRNQSEYRDQFTLLLQKSILLAGNNPSHVIVLSIPDYSVTPFGRELDTALIASQIDSFNLINHKLAMEYKVSYLDITAESRKAKRDPSLIAVDGLHFSGKEYGNWARMMEPLLKDMLQ
jgi:lysophospholipase L1-like esterase